MCRRRHGPGAAEPQWTDGTHPETERGEKTSCWWGAADQSTNIPRLAICVRRGRGSSSGQQQQATPGSALPALLPWLSSLPTYERALFASDDCRVNSRNDDTPEKLRLRKKAPQGETHREKVLNYNHCAESTAGGAPEHGDGVISRGREMRERRIKEREVKWRYEFSPSQKTGLKPQQLQHSTQFMWTRLTCTSHTLYTVYTLYTLYTVYTLTVHSLSEDPLYMQYSHTEETDTRTVYMRTRFIVSVQHHWVHTSRWCTHYTQFTWVSALHALQWWKQ